MSGVKSENKQLKRFEKVLASLSTAGEALSPSMLVNRLGWTMQSVQAAIRLAVKKDFARKVAHGFYSITGSGIAHMRSRFRKGSTVKEGEWERE